MTLQLGGGGAITGCTSLQEPALTLSGLTVSGPLDVEKIIVSSGTAAAPTYTFSGDTDNGLYYAGTNSIGLATNGTNAILIDSTGNVGIGTTSPSFIFQVNANTPRIALQPTADSQEAQILFRNAADNSSPGSIVYDHGNSALLFRANGSERLRIDSSGRLLVGTTSNNRKFVVEQANSTAYSSTDFDQDYHLIKVRNSTNDKSAGIQFSIGGNGDAAITATEVSDGATNLCFGTRGSGTRAERMRIDSIGNLYIGSAADFGTTNWAQTSGAGNWLWLKDDGTSRGGSVVHTTRKGGFAGYYFNMFDWTSGDDRRYFDFYKNGATFSKLQLTSSGSNIELTNQSDYRLKQDVDDYTGALEIVKQLKPKTYNWISNLDHPYKDTGFIAHELQEVLPDLVSGEKDGMGYPEDLSGEGEPVLSSELQPIYQSLDMTRLIPTLTAALKEAIAKIETLETKVEALEAG